MIVACNDVASLVPGREREGYDVVLARMSSPRFEFLGAKNWSVRAVMEAGHLGCPGFCESTDRCVMRCARGLFLCEAMHGLQREMFEYAGCKKLGNSIGRSTAPLIFFPPPGMTERLA